MEYYYDDGEICINDCRVKWTINDIFWFPQKCNVEICSPVFYFSEINWRLRLFPWGWQVPKFENTKGWLGVALCACGPQDMLDDKLFNIRFSIIGKTGEVAANSVPERRKRWYVVDKLLKSKKLRSSRKEMAPNNVLTILCEIEKEEVESDGEVSEADEILYENVSSSTEEIGGSYNQASTCQDGDSNDPSTTQNCEKENSDDIPSASTYTGTESFYLSAYDDEEMGSCYFSVASSDPEEDSEGSTVCEEETAETQYINTPNVGEQLSALPKGVAKALQDYKNLLLNENHSNITIKVRNKQFKAHRNILAARTPVFAAMLKHNMKEKATGVVTIEDMDPESFPDFLEYLYTGQVQNLSSGNVLELFTAADKYQVKELREECYVFMTENLSVENFCGILSLSLRHHEKELITLATQFFIENAVHIVKTPKWQIFMMENAVAANELFIKQLEFNNRKQKQQE